MSDKEEDQIVTMEKGESRISDLWKTEDYWAIWLGFALLIIGMIIYFPRGPAGMEEKILKANSILEAESERAPFKTIAWYQAVDDKKKLKASSSSIGKQIKKFTGKTHKWNLNPITAFYKGEDAAGVAKAKAKYDKARAKEAEALAAAQDAENAAEAEGFTNEALNAEAVKAVDAWRLTHAKASNAKKKAAAKPYNQLPYLLGLMIFLAAFFGIGMKFMGQNALKFMKGFAFVFGISVLAYMVESQATMKHYGIGYAAWSIIFGMLISNTIGTPKWVMPAVQTEYYIKTGLVLLGAEILFGKILLIGVPGIFVAWIVTPILLITTYWIGQKIIKIPSKTLNMTIAADMSVCGVSAAIAVAAACKAKKEELTLAVGLSLVFTSIMMIVMPAFIKAVGMPQILGGAWMGGTIDATGAVAAAGSFLGERALYVAATIKMIQNVLIGIIAFSVAVYWVAKVEATPGQGVRAMEIWYRFPKFVLGFITASIIFSLIYNAMGPDVGYALVDHGAIRGMSKIFRGWFFCLAFTSIGLATDFRVLKEHFKGGKPLILYICGQTLDLSLTLLVAYIMFYIVFPGITARIQ